MEANVGDVTEKTSEQQEAARREFIAELWRRFEALQEWAVATGRTSSIP